MEEESTSSNLEELARFREQWRRDIRAKAGERRAPPTSSEQKPPRPSERDTARQLYNEGRRLELEQDGSLHLAIKFYRRAFQLDPSLAFSHGIVEAHAAGDSGITEKKQFKGEPRKQAHVSRKHPTTSSSKNPTVKLILANCGGQFPVIEAMAPDLQSPLSQLPNEVLVHVLSFLDPYHVELCALVCRALYLHCRNPGHWRRRAQEHWGKSRISHHQKQNATTAINWRKLFLLKPQIHSHGVLIRYTREDTQLT